MRRFFPAGVFLVSLVGASSPGEEPSSLRVSSASGEPGEDVALEFRADLTQPLRSIYVQFDISPGVEFARVEVDGTASAHAMPRGIIHYPRFDRGGYVGGVRFDMQGQRSHVEPGLDLLLFRAVFRVRHDAAPADHIVRVLLVDATTPDSRTIPFRFEDNARFTVLPPSRPRPVGGLSCNPFGGGITLSWALAEEYEAIRIFRDGSLLVELPGSAMTYVDALEPGPRRYAVAAVRGGIESLPAVREVLIEEPRPVPIGLFRCSPIEEGVRLSWTNGEAYDYLAVFRNGKRIADLAGSATQHDDPYRSELFTIYTVQGGKDGVDTLASSCTLNELSERFALRADDVRADPGEGLVMARIFVTNPAPLEALQIALRVDPNLARIRELILDGTVSDAAQYDFFAYQRTLEGGETAAGIGFDYVPPLGFLFPAGGDQHCLTLVLDLLPAASNGSRIPIQLGRHPDIVFGSPPLYCIVTVNGSSRLLEVQDGSILVGDSPIPEIDGARAEPLGAGGGGAGAEGNDGGSIALSWRNAAPYDGIRIERDGARIADLSGESESHIDAHPGPGAHRYRLVAVQAGVESFPAIAWSRPRGIPGTFVRGDADGDGRINLTDAIHIFRHLFQGGRQPECLDAADADDNGSLALTDPIAILIHLFLGRNPLPLPGPEPWFDPSGDDLSCGGGPGG